MLERPVGEVLVTARDVDPRMEMTEAERREAMFRRAIAEAMREGRPIDPDLVEHFNTRFDAHENCDDEEAGKDVALVRKYHPNHGLPADAEELEEEARGKNKGGGRGQQKKRAAGKPVKLRGRKFAVHIPGSRKNYVFYDKDEIEWLDYKGGLHHDLFGEFRREIWGDEPDDAAMVMDLADMMEGADAHPGGVSRITKGWREYDEDYDPDREHREKFGSGMGQHRSVIPAPASGFYQHAAVKELAREFRGHVTNQFSKEVLIHPKSPAARLARHIKQTVASTWEEVARKKLLGFTERFWRDVVVASAHGNMTFAQRYFVWTLRKEAALLEAMTGAPAIGIRFMEDVDRDHGDDHAEHPERAVAYAKNSMADVGTHLAVTGVQGSATSFAALAEGGARKVLAPGLVALPKFKPVAGIGRTVPEAVKDALSAEAAPFVPVTAAQSQVIATAPAEYRAEVASAYASVKVSTTQPRARRVYLQYGGSAAAGGTTECVVWRYRDSLVALGHTLVPGDGHQVKVGTAVSVTLKGESASHNLFVQWVEPVRQHQANDALVLLGGGAASKLLPRFKATPIGRVLDDQFTGLLYHDENRMGAVTANHAAPSGGETHGVWTHDTSTEPGDSGAPITVSYQGNAEVVVAVHAGGYAGKQYNEGIELLGLGGNALDHTFRSGRRVVDAVPGPGGQKSPSSQEAKGGPSPAGLAQKSGAPAAGGVAHQRPQSGGRTGTGDARRAPGAARGSRPDGSGLPAGNANAGSSAPGRSSADGGGSPGRAAQ